MRAIVAVQRHADDDCAERMFTIIIGASFGHTRPKKAAICDHRNAAEETVGALIEQV
jgi:hypothetical protein